MLGVGRPVGAGKTSFMQSGLLPAPHDPAWAFRHLHSRATQPFVKGSLGQAVAGALAGDPRRIEAGAFREPEVAVEVFNPAGEGSTSTPF